MSVTRTYFVRVERDNHVLAFPVRLNLKPGRGKLLRLMLALERICGEGIKLHSIAVARA
jgi:hypothetical protein